MIFQFYHNILLDVERAGYASKCIAIQLHPMIQELLSNGQIHMDEKKIIYVTGPAKINHLSAKKSATFFVFALS